MFCKKCGNPLSDGARFCGKCGTSVTASQNDVQKTLNSNESAYVTEPEPRSGSFDASEGSYQTEINANPDERIPSNSVVKGVERKQSKVSKKEKKIAQNEQDPNIPVKKKHKGVVLLISLLSVLVVVVGLTIAGVSTHTVQFHGEMPFVSFHFGDSTDAEGGITSFAELIVLQLDGAFQARLDSLDDVLKTLESDIKLGGNYRNVVDSYLRLKKGQDQILEQSKVYIEDANSQVYSALKKRVEEQQNQLSTWKSDIVRSIVELGDKAFAGEVEELFAIEMLDVENWHDITPKLADYFALTDRPELLNMVLRLTIMNRGVEGLELVNAIQESQSKKFPNAKKQWTYLGTEEYDSVMNADDGYFKIAKRIDGSLKWGLMNSEGKVLIEPQYELLGNFLEDRAAVQKNGKWGFVDKDGVLVIECQFDDLKQPNDPDFYQFAIRNPENVSRGFYNGFAMVGKNGKWGFVNRYGDLLGPGIVYKDIQNFSEGTAPVSVDGKHYGLLQRDGSYLIDPGKTLGFIGNTEVKLEIIRPIFEGLASVNWKNRTERGVIDSSGRLIRMYDRNSTKITLVQDYREGLMSFRQEGSDKVNRWGFMDRAGNIVIPAVYDSVSIFRDGLSVVTRKGKYGLIDRTGREVLPTTYDWIDSFKGGFSKVIKSKAMALINRNGEIITDFKYGGMSNFSQGIASFEIKGLHGLIDESGKEVLPNVYTKIGRFNNGLAPATKGSGWGFIDTTGFFVVEPLFEEVIAFDHGVTAVKIDGKYKFIKIDSIPTSVTGQVIDEAGTPMPDVAISVYKRSTDASPYLISSTNAEGQYRFIIPEEEYRIVFNKDGFRTSTMYSELSGGEAVNNERVVLIAGDDALKEEIAKVQVKLGESLTGTGLANVLIKFREGYGNQDGDYAKDEAGKVIEINTDDQGTFTTELPVGLYTAEAVKDGYASTFINLPVSTKIDYMTLEKVVPITNILETDQLRMTLEWGSTPPDIDAHLFGVLSDGHTPFHVFYNDKKNMDETAALDKDDREGNGFETVTIYEMDSDVYYYDVYDYSNRDDFGSNEMSNSGAKVKVWQNDTLVAVYDIPTDRVGNLWRVFQIRDGKIIPINEVVNSYNVEEYNY